MTTRSSRLIYSLFGPAATLGQGDEDLRAWVREWATAVRIAADEAHKVNPKLEILPWEYNVAFSPDQAATKAYVMTQLPESTIPLLTFENGKSFELDGQKGYPLQTSHVPFATFRAERVKAWPVRARFVAWAWARRACRRAGV